MTRMLPVAGFAMIVCLNALAAVSGDAGSTLGVAQTAAGETGQSARYIPDVQVALGEESLCLSGTNWFVRQAPRGLGREIAMQTGETSAPAPAGTAGGASLVDTAWLPCAVPGSVQSALIEAGQVPAPWYFAGNVLALAKSTVERDSLFRRTFDVPERWSGRLVRLHLGAVDYAAIFYLNRQEVGRHEGHFERVVLDVSKALRYGAQNELTVELAPFPRSAGARGPERNRVLRSQVLKNILTECTPPVCPLGISDDVYLQATDRLAIDDLCVRAELNDDLSEADVTMILSLNCREAVPAEIHWELLPANFSGPGFSGHQSAGLSPGRQTLTHVLHASRPALWWPREQGSQNLYEARVTLTGTNGDVLDVIKTRVGIRKIERDPKQEWLFSVNNRQLFLKGANWAPMDPFYRANREQYARLLVQLAGANMNVLRWWGGGVPERPAFYDLCDELGLLVYQDFPLANENFDNPAMLDLLEREAADFFRRWRNRPCILAWNGGNEWSSPRANAVLERIAGQEDPTRAYFRPCGTHPGEAHGPYNYQFADLYRRLNAFPYHAYTEFGCAAMANLATLQAIIPASELPYYEAPAAGAIHPGSERPGDEIKFDCELPSWRFHNRQWVVTEGEVNKYLLGWASPSPQRLFGVIDSLPRYVAASQYSSGEGLRYFYEELRRKQHHVGIGLVWQYNETWPNAAGNATVDWFARPRLAHFLVTKACEPVHVSMRYDRIAWRGGEPFTAEVWAHNDLPTDIDQAETQWDIRDASGMVMATGTTGHAVPAALALKAADIRFSIPADYDSLLVVCCTLRDRATNRVLSRNEYIQSAHTSTSHLLSPLTHVAPTTLACTVSARRSDGATLVVKNTGSSMAFVCKLEANTPSAQVVTWSDNAFCLPPGAERSVECVVHSLGGASPPAKLPPISCSAWNSDAVNVSGEQPQ